MYAIYLLLQNHGTVEMTWECSASKIYMYQKESIDKNGHKISDKRISH